MTRRHSSSSACTIGALLALAGGWLLWQATKPGRAQRREAQPEPLARRRAYQDRIDRASDESFPASDPPGYYHSHT